MPYLLNQATYAGRGAHVGHLLLKYSYVKGSVTAISFLSRWRATVREDHFSRKKAELSKIPSSAVPPARAASSLSTPREPAEPPAERKVQQVTFIISRRQWATFVSWTGSDRGKKGLTTAQPSHKPQVTCFDCHQMIGRAREGRAECVRKANVCR